MDQFDRFVHFYFCGFQGCEKSRKSFGYKVEDLERKVGGCMGGYF
jgi:hypothetical protein